MTTRNIVPRTSGEGGIGTAEKKWGNIYGNTANINEINTDNVNSTLLLPETNNTGNVGSIEKKWGNIYANTANINEISVDNINGTSLLPKTNDTGNIGSTEKKWNSIYANTINGASTMPTPNLYIPDISFYSSDKTVITTPSLLKVNINNNEYALISQTLIDITNDKCWDNKATLWAAEKEYKINDVVYPDATKTGFYYRCTTGGKSSSLTPTWPTAIGTIYNDGDVVWTCEYDYTVATNRAGKDFYIYVCVPATGTVPDIFISINSTIPNGYNASTSRKIGGFHCLCADVGTITDHTLSGYTAGDILPASVWDLSHRPKSEPEGMAYIDGLDLWVDIYLSSWSGSYDNDPDDLELVSKYGAVCADGTSTEKFHCFKFEQVFGRQKKRLLYQREFVCASIGSNQSTNVAGGADVNTTGGFKDTAGRRMISNFGLEDCCGNLWQWGADVGSATTGSSSYGNAYTADDKYVAGQEYGGVYRPLLGGGANNAAVCGSRASYWKYGALALNWGRRGAWRV